MKTVILISTLLAAGTLAAFADAPTGTYIDEDGNNQNFEFNGDSYLDYYSLSLKSGTYKDVLISPNDSIRRIEVWIGSGVTFNGFTFNGVDAGTGSYFGGDIGSFLGGNISFSNVKNTNIYSELSSGTHFSIDSNSDIYFYSNVWNIAAEDLSQSLIGGTGTVKMSSSDTFTLNFLSVELLKEQTISLVSAETKVSKPDSGFEAIAITLNGKAVSDYIATQINGGRDILIKYVPEPSFFGLLAGTLALALAGTRRRRRK